MYTFDLESLKERPGERYGAQLDRMEDAVREITLAKDSSPWAIKVLAFVMMEAPADFDYSAQDLVSPSKRVRNFFGEQTEEIKKLFRTEAMNLPRGREDRVNWLLGVS